MAIDRISIARVVGSPDTAWHTVNDAVLETGYELSISAPVRLAGVRLIVVDEHELSHIGRGSKYITVIVDPTPIGDGADPPRLLAWIPSRPKKAFKGRLDAQGQQFRDGIETVAMDGIAGFKTAAAEETPQAVTVMDPSHVVALAAHALDTRR